MVKIGNVVDYGVNKIELPHLNVFKSIEDIDNQLPTLLVGYSEVKLVYENLNFFDKKINDDLYWTFNRVEDRYNYIKDLSSFIDHCESKLTQSFKYLFINPFELNLTQIKRFINHIKTNDGVFLSDGPMIFVTIKDLTYGFHTQFSEILGIQEGKLYQFLTKNNYIKIAEDTIKETQKELGDLKYNLGELQYLREKFAL